ncbi:MAG: PilN domain-containing protein [Verrucomicrobia bacterium]|nr:PilN domain-containing protein [Verrucomicrobiota bacterium]
MKSKALHRIGIAFSAAGLEVAETAHDGGRLRIVRSETFAVAAAPANGDKAAPAGPAWPVEKLKPFRPAAARGVPVSVGLRSADVFCRLVTLPTATDSELRPMLEMQLENLSPLPTEQVVFGFEVIRKTEKQTDLLVAIARRDVAVERLELLRQAGFAVETLDLDALALLDFLWHEKPLRDKELAGLALVILEGETATLLLVHDNQPHSIMAVPLAGDASVEDAAAQIGGELHLAQTAVQASQPEAVWPVVRVLQRSGEGTPGARLDPKALAAALAGQLGVACEPLELSEKQRAGLGAVGLCVRVASGRARMNLVPAEYLAERRRLARKRQFKLAAIALAALYGLIIAGAVAAFAWQFNQLGALEAEADDLKTPYDRAVALQADLRVLQEYVSNRSVPLEIFAELHKLKPDAVCLTEIHFTDGEQASLSGYASSASVVSEFESKLQKSSYFPGGTALSPLTNQKVAGNVVVRFTIQCKIKKAPKHEAAERRRRQR